MEVGPDRAVYDRLDRSLQMDMNSTKLPIVGVMNFVKKKYVHVDDIRNM